MNHRIALFLCGVLAAVLWYFQREAPLDDASLLTNRMWIERMPKDERDLVMQFIALQAEDASGGAVIVASQFRIFIELFQFSLDGTKLSLEFPQDRRKLTATVKTWRCKDTAPKPFELCLEARVLKRRLLLYSREDWVIDPESTTSSIPGLPSLETLSRTPACPECVEGLPPVLEPHLD